MDPTALIITYACDHNHPIPTKSNVSTSAPASAAAVSATSSSSGADEVPVKLLAEAIRAFPGQAELELSDGSAGLLSGYGYHQWFDDDDVVSTSVVLESPIFEGGGAYVDGDVSMAAFSSVSGEDESLFADLGELPECSVVFRRRMVEPDEQNRRCGLSAVPCCGSTG